VSYASSGQGSIQHLVGELFAQNLGINLLHIPYKGGGQAVNDVVAGQVTAAVLGAAAVLPHIKSGKLIALAVSTRQRSPMLPDTPTLAESGAGDIDVRSGRRCSPSKAHPPRSWPACGAASKKAWPNPR
jgi:tripartite-type tricarboxylate transporter receptor subunit TctC